MAEQGQKQQPVYLDFLVATSTRAHSWNVVPINLHKHADIQQAFKGISAQLHPALQTWITDVGRLLLKYLGNRKKPKFSIQQLDSDNNGINNSWKWDLARLTWAWNLTKLPLASLDSISAMDLHYFNWEWHFFQFLSRGAIPVAYCVLLRGSCDAFLMKSHLMKISSS